MQSGLYIVGTPIGNLSDMSPRAIDVLKNVDLIAAEDTRVFGKLAAHFDIKTKRISCHEHNERDVVPDIIEKIQSGLSVAIVSDAGMPGVSDPGFRMVRAARDAGVDVSCVPYPSDNVPYIRAGVPGCICSYSSNQSTVVAVLSVVAQPANINRETK